LVPICPDTLSNRPICVSDRPLIEISLKRSIDRGFISTGNCNATFNEG